MVSIESAALAIILSVCGVGYTSYRLGITKGATDTLIFLENEGIITITEEDDD